jgi:hypothetical protein
MSSSASTARATTDAPVVPAVGDPTPDPGHMTDDVDRSYGKAVIIGSVVGIVLFTIGAWLVLQALAPDWSGGPNAIIAIWMGIWSGLFLGGTIAVGRWSMRQGH